RTTGTMARKCSRDASSGTTPPYLPWVLIWEATIEESTRSPSSTTAAAVSSHDDSMPRMRTITTLPSQQMLEGRWTGTDSVARTEVKQTRSFPGASLGRLLQLQKQGQGRMVRFESFDGTAHAAEDDRQFVIKVMRGGRRHGMGPIGLGY